MTAAPLMDAARTGPGLRALLMAHLGDLCAGGEDPVPTLGMQHPGTAPRPGRVGGLALALARPTAADAPLVAAMGPLGLGVDDIVGLALAEAVEAEPVVSATLRAIQGAGYGPWPSIGLLVRLLDRLDVASVGTLPAARAFAIGLLAVEGARAPLHEQAFQLGEALRDVRGLRPGPGGPFAQVEQPAAIPPGWQRAAETLAPRLAGRPVALVLRQGERADRIAYADLVARAGGRRAVTLPPRPDAWPGLGAALEIANCVPVERLSPAAGQEAEAADLAPYRGLRVVVSGSGGRIMVPGFEVIDAPLPEIAPEERRALWARALPDDAIIGALGRRLADARFGPGRIAGIGARAALEPGWLEPRLRRAMGAELRADLEPHATLVSTEVPEDGLAAEPALRRDLALLLARCAQRHAAATATGATRMPGVRALLAGPSGTGKTHACAWLATRLGLPLFRLDLAAVVSKFIGETEENLGRLLDQAEAADAVLLMDEADSLFGARTEARDGTDRFANNQTNYLLGRIETFDGIVLLTTNARERIDAAFSRRLDQIVEVPLPAPRERRRIWQLTLGDDHRLAPGEINRLASLVDLSGGHLRNIAVTARVLATAEGRAPGMGDVVVGVEQEYRKLGRPAPGGLAGP